MDRYSQVKTAQDLIELGVIPKTSRQHLALIAYKRLKGLRDNILSDMDEDLLGRWIPAIEQGTEENGGDFTEEENIVYTLAEDVVADENLGHRVRLTKESRGGRSRGYNEQDIPEGTKGTIVDFDNNYAQILVDDVGKGPVNLFFNLEQLVEGLEVSSLGQDEPRDREEVLREQVLFDFFPKTVISAKRAERAILGIMAEKRAIFYGPRGSGKSELVDDIVDIAMSQDDIFIVEDCNVQCNPYSLMDHEFAKVVPPCPQCMIKYSPDFRVTKRFSAPNAKEIKVTVGKYGWGLGIELIQSNNDLNTMHFTGFKMPVGGSTEAHVAHQDQSDPSGFTPGFLSRINNGMVIIEEAEKLREPVYMNLLTVFQKNMVSPDQLSDDFPGNGGILGNANSSNFPPELNDRVLLQAIRYTRDTRVAKEITRRAIGGEFIDMGEVDVGDTHTEEAINLMNIPVPQIISDAIDHFYINLQTKLENEQTSDDEFISNNDSASSEILASTRSKKDAHHIARAWVLIDNLFYENAPEFVDESYAIKGLQFALCSRVVTPSRRQDQETKSDLCDYIQETFPELIQEETNTWWCETYKSMARLGNTIQETFFGELEVYEQFFRGETDHGALLNAYETVKSAKEKGGVSFEHPFMDHLFNEQLGMHKLEDDKMIATVGYLLKRREGASCVI